EKLNPRPRHIASYWALGAVAALAAGGKATSTESTGPSDDDGAEATGGENAQSTGGSGGTEDQVGSGGTENPDPPAAGCPWVGYGVGIEAPLCSSAIVSAHAVDACAALGGDTTPSVPKGQATTVRIVGDCGSEAQ